MIENIKEALSIALLTLTTFACIAAMVIIVAGPFLSA